MTDTPTIIATSPVIEMTVRDDYDPVWPSHTYFRAECIYYPRQRFLAFVHYKVKDYDPQKGLRRSRWMDLWGKFDWLEHHEQWKVDAIIAAEDARDLRDTQQDALS